MAEEERDEGTLSGHEVLEAAWWEAVDELRFVIADSESVADRINACDVLLSYTARMNQGLNAPFVPESRPERDEDEDDSDSE
jgi:hypothetical protein